MKSLVPPAVLLLVLPLATQEAPPALRGLTAEQLMTMRQVRSVHAGEQAAAFVVRVPKPIAEGSGPAASVLFGIPDPGNPGRHVELLGADDDFSGVALRPGTSTVTFVREGAVHGIPAGGGESRVLVEVPQKIRSYWWRPDGEALVYTALDPMPPARAAARERGIEVEIVDEDWRHASLWLWEQEAGGGEEGEEDEGGGDAGTPEKLTHGRTVYDAAWTPDGTRLALALAPRHLVDDSYMFKRLFELDLGADTLSPLVDNPGKLGDFVWSNDGERLAYLSAADERDPHAGMLYVLDRTTGEVTPLTEGFRGMVHQIEWSGDETVLASISEGVATELAFIDARRQPGTRRTLLDPVAAFHEYARIGPGNRFLIVGSTPGHPDELLAVDPTSEERLTDSNPWLEDVALGRQEVVRFEARDGLRIEGLLLYPVGHEAGRRYPLVIVVHGGPESHHINGWLTRYSEWGQLLAGRGYFVWYPNYRASTGYGVEFAKADHGDPMGGEFRDHLDAIAHLDHLGLIDTDRVGIGGGSYGGYTAAWAATWGTEHFAAAVSFVPFVHFPTKWMTSDIPWEFYYVHYQEKWPWEQPGLLSDRSPFTWATRCRTPLLLCGGTADTRVHPAQPFMLYSAIKFGTDTPVRYVRYPGEGHGNRVNVHRYDYCLRALRWFDHYLKGGDRSTPPPVPDLEYAQEQ